MFRYADVHCVCNSILREYSEMTRTKPLDVIRKNMATQCVDILYAYRQHCASNHSSGQVSVFILRKKKIKMFFLNFDVYDHIEYKI